MDTVLVNRKGMPRARLSSASTAAQSGLPMAKCRITSGCTARTCARTASGSSGETRVRSQARQSNPAVRSRVAVTGATVPFMPVRSASVIAGPRRRRCVRPGDRDGRRRCRTAPDPSSGPTSCARQRACGRRRTPCWAGLPSSRHACRDSPAGLCEQQPLSASLAADRGGTKEAPPNPLSLARWWRVFN